MDVSLVLMEPDAYHLPACEGFHIGLEFHELLILHSLLDVQHIFTEGDEGFLALLTSLGRVQLLCLVNQGDDGLAALYHLILKHHSVVLGEMGIHVRGDFPLASVMLQTVGLGGFNVC